ncbi:MAG: HEAT repeat domain-containing protein [Verrucomicrobia bacterium]|nr:HEAT repeat domain-containing protein [Verrucomicrobiota bacterium]MBS0646446.1 HEAT repeat domain-containing protein [Verrucomicrobiota bacterium]
MQKTLFVTTLLLTAPLCAEFPLDVSGNILYLVHRGSAKTALERYVEQVHATSQHDYLLLQQIGLAILEEGASSGDPEIEVMTLLGAGVSLSSRLIPILEQGLKSEDPRLQLIALNFLSKINDDEVDHLLLSALSSPFLLTRLEALYQLSLKRHPSVLEHLQSLFVKIPDPIRPLFAQIVVNLDSLSANQMMRQLLSDHDLTTRCEAILAIAEKQRDDFLPQIRTLATQTQVTQQECVASTLGQLKDRSSIPLLQTMAHARQRNVALAASFSLYQIGDKTYLPLIFEAAQQHDLVALTMLAQIPLPQSADLLAQLCHCSDKDVELGAALALLDMRDSRCFDTIKEVLLSEKDSIGYVLSRPPGRAAAVWRTVLSAPYKEQSYPGILQQSAALRHQILVSCVELPEHQFLNLAEALFDAQIKSLVPVLVELLANHHSEDTLALLKKQSKTNPSDFIKTSCLLALYRSSEEGDYEHQLIDWVKKRNQTMMIRFEAPSSAERACHQSLSAEEESALLIETYESLASTQSQAGIEALLNAIAYGNVKNRYALAGLLIRTAE